MNIFFNNNFCCCKIDCCMVTVNFTKHVFIVAEKIGKGLDLYVISRKVNLHLFESSDALRVVTLDPFTRSWLGEFGSIASNLFIPIGDTRRDLKTSIFISVFILIWILKIIRIKVLCNKVWLIYTENTFVTIIEVWCVL